jgi:hypothetical protein
MQHHICGDQPDGSTSRLKPYCLKALSLVASYYSLEVLPCLLILQPGGGALRPTASRPSVLDQTEGLYCLKALSLVSSYYSLEVLPSGWSQSV